MTQQKDFWALRKEGYFKLPGVFASTWLQEHREDPYWMAHQLADALMKEGEPYNHVYFNECWKLARQIHGIEE